MNDRLLELAEERFLEMFFRYALPVKSIQGISPIYCVKNVEATTAWYVKHLGFETRFLGDDYAIIAKDGFSIHLSQVADETLLKVTANNIEFFIECGDIDAYFAEVLESGPQTQISAVADRPWGNREFHIKDLDGALIRVGRFGV